MALLEEPVSFIATIKAKKSRHFYETVLGLQCLSEDSFAIVFALGSTQLRIQKVEFIPAINHTVLGWNVGNLKECVTDLTNNGVQFEFFAQLPQDALGIWSSPSGASIAWFKDPDENTLSLTEF